MSRKYASRIASIPAPPVRPRYVRAQKSVDDDLPRSFNASPSPEFQPTNELGLDLGDRESSDLRYMHQDYTVGAEEAAKELEDSVLGDSISALHSKDRLIDRKRGAAATVLSDASSDFDVPSISQRDGDGVATKKRKLDVDMDDITDELERSIAGDKPSITLPGKKSVSKGRGKGSLTPLVGPGSELGANKPRKKPGPRKKGDTLPLKSQDLMGPPSASGSIAGDMTPAPSVPASPALSTAVVYELNEPVAPLKRAKKVDETAMLKRVYALEEAQRKVWINIAKRDVAKVGIIHLSKAFG